MTSAKILSLYKNTVKITKSSKTQRTLFKQFLAQSSRLMVFDTETTGVVFDESTILYRKGEEGLEVTCKTPVIFGISFALVIKKKIVLVWARVGTNLCRQAICLLYQKGTKVAHNARYDLRMLELEVVPIKEPVECTYTMARIVYDRRKKHSLQSLSEVLCPELSDWEEPVKRELTRLKGEYTRAGYPKNYVNYSFVDNKLMGKYSMMDSFMTLMLYYKLNPIIEENFKELYEREKKVFHIINKIEKRGLAFNILKAKGEIKKIQRQVNKYLKSVDFNPNSPAQVLKALKLIGVKQKELMLKGKVTTEAKVLRSARDKVSKTAQKFIDELLGYRALTKILGTYLIPLTERAVRNNGIVYTSINPSDTRTGRMASRSPNLQNIPEPIIRKTGSANAVRSCFACRSGYNNYYFDYAQMEMVIFGLWTNEERILDAYRNGEDIHDQMAIHVYGENHTKEQRDQTKSISFGIIYGMGIKALAMNLDIKLSAAKTLMNIYYDEFPSIRDFQSQCKYELQDAGYVKDWFGKRYSLAPAEAYKAVNALVQGSCAQIFKIALIAIHEYIHLNNWVDWRPKTNLLLPVHDEFQFESTAWENKAAEYQVIKGVIECMVKIPQLQERELLLRVDVSKSETNWAEKKKLEI